MSLRAAGGHVELRIEIPLALECYQRAIKADADYAAAHAGLADAYTNMALIALGPPHEVMPRAREAAERALALDDRLSDAHCSLGYVNLMYDWNWSDAQRRFERAIELNANNVTALTQYGHVYHAYVNHRIDE